MNKPLQIALDGPAGAGKSTIAKTLAKKLGYVYIDTGAIYRAVTYRALKDGVGLEDGPELADMIGKMDLRLVPSENGQRVFDGADEVTDVIRTSEVTNNVSFVARQPEVRSALMDLQRDLASKGGIVMDGRDIGTHVLPDADLKVFMTATVEERARRRHEENVSKGLPSDLEQLQLEIALRDKRDSEREVAPLRQADDAHYLDTTELSIEGVVEAIEHLMKQVIER
ncbi:(d)CMP kinase [Exiguobacterium sp. AM39-5BH]|uniref:(d)CMP kinase n=1 Tax=Exiguobacterium sp. AM39-5BH TaxID=2292355 RepID=UPI000FE2594E|nr:(d)CMP kinase [Exiguobacterium sp. AM39-5BH]RHB51076.1 (d)CMP kinase [Exiguobacterium sp. AM39-5BH]